MQLLRVFVRLRPSRWLARMRRADAPRAYTVTVPAPLAPPSASVVELRPAASPPVARPAADAPLPLARAANQ